MQCLIFDVGPATGVGMIKTAESKRLWIPLIIKSLLKLARKHVGIAISVVPYSLTGRWELEISFLKLDLVMESVGFSKYWCWTLMGHAQPAAPLAPHPTNSSTGTRFTKHSNENMKPWSSFGSCLLLPSKLFYSDSNSIHTNVQFPFPISLYVCRLL